MKTWSVVLSECLNNKNSQARGGGVGVGGGVAACSKMGAYLGNYCTVICLGSFLKYSTSTFTRISKSFSAP